MTSRYPLFLDLDGRRVVVVGGGGVAVRRVTGLLPAGARVLVVAPAVDPAMPASVEVRLAPYSADVLDGAALVLACTDRAEVNAAVAADAAGLGVWCIRADDAAGSAAWVPATATVDGVQVAVAGGGDPRRAAAVRSAVEALLRAGELPARRTRRTDLPGRVVLVGGGPGDVDLLTLRGLRALLDADVVVHDRLSPGGVLDLLDTDVEVIDVGKTPRGPGADQEAINALLVERATAGAVVARLKGGDPFVFGRGSEELGACRAAGVAVEIVPGLSSATAAPGLAGVPVTERGTEQLFTVVSGHVPPGDPRSTVDWAGVARSGGTLVLLMAVANLAAIARALLDAGRPAATPVAIVEAASSPSQRTVAATLEQVAGVAGPAVRNPAVVVVGEVAALLRPGGAGAPFS